MLIQYLSPKGLKKLASELKAAFSEKDHSHQLSDLSGTVPVSKGGTGATEAAQARTNLGVTPANIGAAPASHTHDAGNIASGLIPIVRGGTGGATPAAARQNLGITPQNIGALPASGGTMTESIWFEGNTVGLVWETANGTVFSLRPYANGNVFQITTKGPNTDDAEQPTFDIHDDGHLHLYRALGVDSGGTGAADAATARANLAVPEVRNRVVITANQGGIGPGIKAGEYWQFWNLQDGDEYPAGLCPSTNGRQLLGHSSYRIKEAYINNFPCGTWNGNAIAVNKGGTGASDAAAARANLGALATSGGPITGYLQFGTMSNGLEWFTANGTQIHLRPYTPNNVFQITFKGPDTENREIGAVNIDTSGHVNLGQPLGVESGGTGATDAAGARNNLAVPELRNGVVIVGNLKGIGTGVSAGQYWQLWNLQNGSTYPVGLVPSENGTQYLGQNGYRIKAVYANDYPCGTWNGNAIAVAKGGTGATSAAGARANLGIGVADTASGSITYNSAGQQVNFGKTLSKVPIVICIQNGGDFANYKVGNITRTGFTISASATGTTWQYVALCV